MAPRPSPVYILVAAPQLAAALRRSSGCARGAASICPERRLRARREPQLELRPVAARDAALPEALSALHGQVGALLDAVQAVRDRGRRVPGAPRRADTEAIETAAQLCREGHIVVMFPEGTRRKKGLRKKYEARAAHRRRADRARGRRPARPGRRSSAPTGSARLGQDACRVRRRRCRSTTSPAARTRRRSRPSG